MAYIACTERGGSLSAVACESASIAARRERAAYRFTSPQGSEPSATKCSTAVISSPTGWLKSMSDRRSR